MNFATYEVGATVVPLVLTINQEGIGGVTGESPTVALRDASTANSYLDWTDNTFKIAGWGLKNASMTEVERGHYQRVFDSSLVAVIADGTVVAAEFHVDDGAQVVGDDADLILFTVNAPAINVGAIADAVWDELLAGHLAVGSTGEALSDAAAGGGGGGGGASWDDLVAAHQVPGSFGEMISEIRREEEEDDFRVEGD